MLVIQKNSPLNSEQNCYLGFSISLLVKKIKIQRYTPSRGSCTCQFFNCCKHVSKHTTSCRLIVRLIELFMFFSNMVVSKTKIQKFSKFFKKIEISKNFRKGAPINSEHNTNMLSSGNIGIF